MKNIYFLLKKKPTQAQVGQCSAVRKAINANHYMCKLAHDGNATIFGDVKKALSGEQARQETSGTDWNGPVTPDA